jgi:hypothetical protein
MRLVSGDYETHSCSGCFGCLLFRCWGRAGALLGSGARGTAFIPLSVERFQEISAKDVLLRLPGVLCCRVAFPLDKELIDLSKDG